MSRSERRLMAGRKVQSATAASSFSRASAASRSCISQKQAPRYDTHHPKASKNKISTSLLAALLVALLPAGLQLLADWPYGLHQRAVIQQSHSSQSAAILHLRLVGAGACEAVAVARGAQVARHGADARLQR